MILILTQKSDVHADRVEYKLRQRGADFVRFDPAHFPSAAEISIAHSPTEQPCHTLRLGNERIHLDSLTSAWYRRPELPVPDARVTDLAVRDYVERESRAYVHGLWDCLDCLWLPAPWSVLQRAENKALQLQLAGELGFELPPTLFTNSPADFLAFYHAHGGNVISKLVGRAFAQTVGTRFVRYTEIVSPRDAGYAHSVRYAPVIFQAYVPKRVELRITVVGQRVFAAEIHSQESNHAQHDWRRYDLHQTPYLPHHLPEEVEQRCLRLVERLGLCYGAIDMIVTPDGRYVFLEINPTGQYLWVEEVTGLPISDAVCDLLMAGRPAAEPALTSNLSFAGALS
jgi:hypothetical protein